MMTTLKMVIIAVTLLVSSGTGAALAAAQESRPDNPLYEFKLFLEDARLNMTNDPEAEQALAARFAAERLDEIVTFLVEGKPIPQLTMEKYVEQVRRAEAAAQKLGDGGSQSQIQAHKDFIDDLESLPLDETKSYLEPVIATDTLLVLIEEAAAVGEQPQNENLEGEPPDEPAHVSPHIGGGGNGGGGGGNGGGGGGGGGGG